MTRLVLVQVINYPSFSVHFPDQNSIGTDGQFQIGANTLSVLRLTFFGKLPIFIIIKRPVATGRNWPTLASHDRQDSTHCCHSDIDLSFPIPVIGKVEISTQSRC
ncbi:hypothetical protein Mettu_1967 [Methylobacter tundripaludum SV96]|uniref:Uncharacterized protein n=1 Tax=Methylobacter tundripaludum (strain ATCC BAA-1195 / DSM 17260 / SV96) TaxID=697282 RepID=G3IWR8_METTV|nr:hypothetical protein Mettu_1967 [Methylobacter tundripaludum SV96]